MTPDFEQSIMNHIIDLKSTASATAQSVADLRNGLQIVLPELKTAAENLSTRVAKVETHQGYITGIGAAITFVITSLLALVGLWHK